MKKKILVIIFILVLMIFGFSKPVYANKNSNTTIKKVVSIVYDDSGSMNNSEAWSFASYSLQNLIGLMDINDELSVVKMSKPSQIFDINLSSDSARKSDIKSVEGWKSNGNTPFSAVDTAANWLKTKKASYVNSQTMEYWLIVITDGSFVSGYPKDMKAYLNNLKSEMGNNNFESVFVAIGNNVPNKVKNDWSSAVFNHLITAKNSNDIVNAMSEVVGLILGQGGKSANIIPTINDDAKSITFKTPFPLKKFIIYEQNQKVNIINIMANEKEISVISDFSAHNPGKDDIDSRMFHCEMVNDFISVGEITIKFDSEIDVASNKFKILVIPALNVELKILDKKGNIIDDLNSVSFIEGELLEFVAIVTSSIDNKPIDLKNWKNELSASLIVNDKNIRMEYNVQDNAFYGTYKIETGSNITNAIVTLPGYFRAKSDTINLYPKEIVNKVTSNVSGNKVEVPYKYVLEYEEIAVFEYTVTGGKINGICDFYFKYLPKGITVSVNGVYVDKEGKVSLKIYNDVPAIVKFYRNKDYVELEQSKVKIEVTSQQYELNWKEDSITEIILSPVKRKITLEEFKLEEACKLKLNNFNDKDIYIISVLGNNEYLKKEELQSLKLENDKIRGISLEKEVIEYNGRYALKISCKRNLPQLLVQTGNIKTNIYLKTMYGEDSEVKEIIFNIEDSLTKYLLPLLILILLIILIGYLPGIKKKIYDKKYHIQANNDDERIYIKKITRILPYVKEKGIGSDLTIIATSNKNKIDIVNNFDASQKIYLNDELIEENLEIINLAIGSKLTVKDGHRETTYMYVDSREDNDVYGINDIDDLDDMFNFKNNIDKNNNYYNDYFK